MANTFQRVGRQFLRWIPAVGEFLVQGILLNSPGVGLLLFHRGLLCTVELLLLARSFALLAIFTIFAFCFQIVPAGSLPLCPLLGILRCPFM